MRMRSRWDCRTARPKPGMSSAPRPEPRSPSASIGGSRAQQLRQAVDDGSISDLVVWRTVSAGRRHLRAGRNDPRDRRRARHCRDPAAQRRDVPPVRPRPPARASHRARDRGGRRRTGPRSGAAEPAQRRADAARLRPPLRARADRAGARLQLVPGSETGDLASRSERRCRRRIVRRCHGRCRFRAVGPRRHPRRQDRHGGPRGVHGHRPDPAPAAAPRTGGPNGLQGGRRKPRCRLPLTRAKAASTDSRLETTK